jgi:hypothetical protein
MEVYMLRVILYKVQSQYGALRVHIDQLAKAFNDMGHEAVIVDFMDDKPIDKLEKELRTGCNFIFALNAIASELKVGSKSIYDVLNVPYITLLVDHPCYHIERLSNNIEKYVVACLDKSHLKFMSQNFDENRFRVTCFMPPAGNCAEGTDDGDIQEYEKNRDISLLFTGSFRGLPVKGWIADNTAVRSIAEDVCDYALSLEYTDIGEAYDYVMVHRGLSFSPEQDRKIRRYIVQKVDGYIAALHRYKFLNTLANAGMPVNIYGNGWDEIVKQWKSFTFNETGSVANTIKLLRRTRFSLNTNNNFASGGHERVFNSMLNGACVVSDTSRFYEEEFNNNKDIIMFKWSELEKLPARINSLINDTEKQWSIAQAGKAIAQERHKWENRVETITQLYELANI